MNAPLEPPLSVSELVGRDAFDSLEAQWSRCQPAAPRGPFASYPWTQLWLTHFAPENQVRVIRVERGPQAIGFAPFLERSGRLLGLPVRLWQSPSNEHSQRVEWGLSDAPRTAVRAIWERLRERDWEVLLLKDLVEQGEENQALVRAAIADGFLVSSWKSLESPWLPVPKQNVESSLKTKFRANLRRRRKKLAELGSLRLERVERGEGVHRALQVGLALEAGGWKGRRGTAILSQPQTVAFYRSLAMSAAQQGWLALYLLYAGERPVAFHFALEHRNRYLLLKPGYDETLSECSPGQLMVGEVLRDLSLRGIEEFDFLGPKMPWKLDWTDQLRSHCWTFILRPTRKGRLLHGARFRWGPQLRRWLREVKTWRA